MVKDESPLRKQQPPEQGSVRPAGQDSEAQQQPADAVPPLGRPYKIDFNEIAQPAPPPQSGGDGFLSGFRAAPATPIVIAINFIVFGLMVATSGGEGFMQPSQKLLVDWGADYGPLTLNGEYWRALTNVFVHIGIIHIGMNMYVLWDVGNVLERLYGTSKFMAIYLLAGLGGSVVSLFFNPTIISAGASGAVFGAFGGLLAIIKGHANSFDKGYIQNATRAVVFLLVYNLIWGFSQRGIDNSAHIGGFVTGVLAGFALLPPRLNEKRWTLQNVVWALLLFGMICGVGYADFLSFGTQTPAR